jgi:parallel beta-helix repeat protein
VLGVAFGLALAAATPNTLFVSPQGRAEATGSNIDDPLPSITAARDAIRNARRQGNAAPFRVLFRGGTYRLAETVVFTAEDKGAIYQAYPAERPILSGGRPITGWKKGAGNIWTAPADWHFRQLFVNGRRAQRARTPTNGFYRIDGPSSQDKPFLLKYRGDDVRPEWAGKDVEVVALLAWAEIRMPIVSVDTAARVARLTGDPRPSNKERDARYWIENAPGGLDAAGEWQLDRAAGAVSYWPVSGEDMTREEVVAPALVQLVRLDGARDLTFRGLDFRHADWTMGPQGYADTQAATAAPVAFEAVHSEGIVVEDCVFTQLGGYALWFGRGSKRARILGNHIFDVGAGGVKLGEPAQRPDEKDQNYENIVTDNEIHDLGSVYPAAVGILVQQSGRNVIAHNHIHDLYYTAISVGWTWGYGANQSKANAIEFNHLHHIGKDMLSDMGAIYTLGVQPGTTIRNNLIHDVSSFTYGGWGIYPDEGSSEMVIENNVVYRTKSAGFHQHYGRGNTVRNNIFAFGREFQVMRTRAEPHLSFTFEGNIVYFDQGRLLGSNWTGENFRLNRNIYWDAREQEIRPAGKSWQEWQKAGQDADSIIADPLFVNAPGYDFTLRPESPALKMGFQPIDLRNVGPRRTQ